MTGHKNSGDAQFTISIEAVATIKTVRIINNGFAYHVVSESLLYTQSDSQALWLLDTTMSLVELLAASADEHSPHVSSSCREWSASICGGGISIPRRAPSAKVALSSIRKERVEETWLPGKLLSSSGEINEKNNSLQNCSRWLRSSFSLSLSDFSLLSS